MAYIGKEPASGIRNRFIFTATAGQTTFSGTDDHNRTLSYTDAEFTDVFLNGIKLDKSDYTATSGTSIVLDEAAAVDDIIEVIAFDTFSVFSGEFGQDVTVGGDLTVDTDTLVVDSTNNRVGIGTSSPARELSIGDGTGSPNIQLLAANTGNSRLEFGDTDDSDVGEIQYLHGDNAMLFHVNATERMRIDSSGNVGIGTSSPSKSLHVYHPTTNKPALIESGDAFSLLEFKDSSTTNIPAIGADGNNIIIQTGSLGSERMRIDSSGTVLVGKTSGDNNANGVILRPSSYATFTNTSARAIIANRKTSDGSIIDFRKDNATVGSIFSNNGIYAGFGNTDVGLLFLGAADDIRPWNTSTNAARDNAIDLGNSDARFDDIYASNTSIIGTSDANEKQQIASLTDAEINAAKALSKLFKTFKWNSAVESKGDNARTHTGHIAQDVQQAMTDAGLDAGDYAFFISSTWWETQTEVPAVEAVEAQDAVYETQTDGEGNETQVLISEAVEAVEATDAYTRTDTYDTAEEAPEGATERTRLGIRYPELLAFVGAATEQRLADIETRLTALEAN